MTNATTGLRSVDALRNGTAPRESKRAFVRALAEYLAGDAAAMSAGLAARRPDAIRWQSIRSTTPLFGWQSVDEAERVLLDWLGL